MTVTKRDNDGHRYEIPASLEAQFDSLFNAYCNAEFQSDEYWDFEEAFNNTFYQYMVG
ncbi:MAG TPA: hypothetical protein VFM18_18950 [Methanosarcina sp.]|nr:hypothetical protein [Methanosarcina sp.]